MPTEAFDKWHFNPKLSLHLPHFTTLEKNGLQVDLEDICPMPLTCIEV